MYSYIVLFVSAFIAATLLPFSSELTLAALLSQPAPVFLLWMTATLGNSLGAAFNWVLGRYAAHFSEQKWFPFNANEIQRAQQWFNRYGYWSVLFSWLPIVGDGLTLIAGLMRMRFILFITLVVIAKGGRYALVIAAYFGFLEVLSIQ